VTAVRWPRRMTVRWSRVVSCGHYVLTGQVIIMRDARWICRPCALAAPKTTAGSPPAAAPTKETPA
jgi:hypothetical protein